MATEVWIAQSPKELGSSDLQSAFSSSTFFTTKLVWIQLNLTTVESYGYCQMQRSESLRAEVETPPQDFTPAQKQSWRDCSSKTVSVLRSLLCGTFLSTLAVHMLLCVHLLPFCALSRIRTISAELVKDYVGVSSPFQWHPSQGDLYFNRQLQKMDSVRTQEKETLRVEGYRASVRYSCRRCLLCLVGGGP